MNSKFILLIATVSLTGCATTIVPIGDNKYEMLRHSATTVATGTAEKAELLEQATNFCNQRSKQFKLLQSRDQDGHLGEAAAEADIIFTCQ